MNRKHRNEGADALNYLIVGLLSFAVGMARGQLLSLDYKLVESDPWGVVILVCWLAAIALAGRKALRAHAPERELVEREAEPAHEIEPVSEHEPMDDHERSAGRGQSRKGRKPRLRPRFYQRRR